MSRKEYSYTAIKDYARTQIVPSYVVISHLYQSIDEFSDLDIIRLSSPTMHTDELKYMQEAYETNWM